MLSREQRGAQGTIWSPYGAQFGAQFGEEQSWGKAIGEPSLNTWSWTERNRNGLSQLSRAVNSILTLGPRAS
jgi:hypothetical protein